MVKKVKRSPKTLSVYSNLANQHKQKKDARQRRKAEYLATLPKHPVQRVLYRLHPKRFWAYWFSREGLLMAGKIVGVGILLLVLLIAGLFAYYRQEIASIRPGELSSRVQTTVSRYYDRNGVLLWEDKGSGDYKLVVKSEEIADSMKKATIAIEDKDFYKHGGFSATGIARAIWNNLKGGDTQGASTLTQQLVKQVFFRDESADRSFGGVPRKIKETILAIEVERSYNKDQILTMYLNESSYGGRRNGVQSAARTYFEKDAKDLTLAESALLASIPQQPGRFDPYHAIDDPAAKKALLARQQTTLDYMVEQGYITQKEAADAKKVAVLDTVKPEAEQFKDIKAPHFVQMVKGQLESELGQATVGAGGLSVKTTLDIRVQDTLDKAINDLFASYLPRSAGFDNGAATVIDTPTGQILGLRGSRAFDYPGYGATNAATAFIQPGSSIKPLVYSALFKQRSDQNYGTGSILIDRNIDKQYGGQLGNWDNKFLGPLTIRNALAGSRNTTAVQAYLIAGRELTLNTIHEMGDLSYCTNGANREAAASMAIGGCEVKQIEHTNAIATLARLGKYEPVTSVLEVRNSEGQVIKKWKDDGKQVLDPQAAYMINDILSDSRARTTGGAYTPTQRGLYLNGVKSAGKTGTSNMGTKSKDLWMASWTPRATMTIWVGNNVPAPMNNALSSIVGPTLASVMEPIHKDIFAKDGSWKPGDWFERPAGIQVINGELYPSWYNRSQGSSYTKMVFDKVSRKKATDCTPENAKETVDVQKFIDPITKKDAFIAPSGYDTTADDDLHKCDDVKPFVTIIDASNKKITATVTQGTHAIQTVSFSVNGSEVGSLPGTGSDTYSISTNSPGNASVTVTVTDVALYSGSLSATVR